MYVSWVLADKLRIVMSSIMRWRRGEIGFVIGELLSLDCTNVQSLQTGDCLPMPSLRSSRPIGHDHYRNVRQSDRQIQHSQLAIGLQTFATGWLPRSGLVQRDLWNIRRSGHCGLIPANLTTVAHFSVSSAMILPNSAGEPASAVPPKSASCAFILESARPALISLLSLSMVSVGVFLGAPIPYHVLAS